MEKSGWTRIFVSMIVVAVIMIPIILTTQPTFLAFGGGGSTVIVDINGNGDYTSIQDALDESGGGEIYRVWAGIYYETVFCEASGVQIIGNGTDTIISAIGSASPPLTIDSPNVTISNMHIRGGTLRAVIIDNGYVNISNCLITNSTDGLDAQLAVGKSNLQIYNCTFRDNTGHAMVVKGYTTGHIRNCNVSEGNSILWCQNVKQFDVSNNYFTDVNYLGGMFRNCQNMTIHDNLFTDIRASSQIGISIELGGYNEIHSNIITRWSKDEDYTTSAGIMLSETTRNAIYGNEILYNEGGITIRDSSHNNTIHHNIIQLNEIGIYIDETSMDNLIYQNNFILNVNHAMDNGTDNHWNRTTFLGGGNYWDDFRIPDDNGDGFVDIPRSVDTTAYDYLPLTNISFDNELWIGVGIENDEEEVEPSSMLPSDEPVVVVIDNRLPLLCLMFFVQVLILAIAIAYDITHTKEE